MHVVDRVRVVIFVVPAERREAHANIQPGDHHARNIGFDVAEERLLERRYVIQVKRMGRVLVVGIARSHRESTNSK